MIVMRTKTVIEVKRTLGAEEYVRIGATKVCWMKADGTTRWGPIERPHDEWTIGQLSGLLEKLEEMP